MNQSAAFQGRFNGSCRMESSPYMCVHTGTTLNEYFPHPNRTTITNMHICEIPLSQQMVKLNTFPLECYRYHKGNFHIQILCVN